MEHIPNQIPSDRAPSLETTNHMQIALAEASGDIAGWIENNAAYFREIVTEDAALVTEYAHHPEEVLATIQERLSARLH